MANYDKEEAINVLGGKLEPCSHDPVTGFFRDGYCNTCASDFAQHTVCIEASEAFLQYSRFRGNDLSTPIKSFDFPGLKPGDRWCLSAQRWYEAYQLDMAPKIFLKSTHYSAVNVISLNLLMEHAADLD